MSHANGKPRRLQPRRARKRTFRNAAVGDQNGSCRERRGDQSTDGLLRRLPRRRMANSSPDRAVLIVCQTAMPTGRLRCTDAQINSNPASTGERLTWRSRRRGRPEGSSVRKLSSSVTLGWGKADRIAANSPGKSLVSKAARPLSGSSLTLTQACRSSIVGLPVSSAGGHPTGLVLRLFCQARRACVSAWRKRWRNVSRFWQPAVRRAY